MVTIVVGRRNESNVCRIFTVSEDVGCKTLVEFHVPTENNPLEAGEPKWANYIKGVIQYFEGKSVTRNFLLHGSLD